MARRPSPPSSARGETEAKEKKSSPSPTKRRSLANIPVVEAGEVMQSGRSGHNASPTIETINSFLAAVVEHAGNITRACKESGMPRYWIYEETERNEVFAERFRQAQQMGLDALEDEARRRSFEGVERNVYYKGQAVGVEKQYSNSLIALLLKGGKPDKYKDRTEITGNAANPLAMEVGPTPLVLGFLEGLREPEGKK